jgi:hypothetical protein
LQLIGQLTYDPEVKDLNPAAAGIRRKLSRVLKL